MEKVEWNRVGVNTAARLLGMQPRKVRRLLKVGRLKGTKVNGVWEIPRRQLPKQMSLPFEQYRKGAEHDK